MQEEVTQKTIALSMKTGKLTAQVLQMALKKYLEARKHGPKLHHGQQSLFRLCSIWIKRNQSAEKGLTEFAAAANGPG